MRSSPSNPHAVLKRQAPLSGNYRPSRAPSHFWRLPGIPVTPSGRGTRPEAAGSRSPGRVAAAHTLAREERATTAFRFHPTRYTSLSVPTLLLTGTESPEVLRTSTQVVADALPDARVEVFDGHGHTAMDSAPHLFADAVVRFLTEP